MLSCCKHCLSQARHLRTRSAIARFYATSSRTFADLGLPPVLLNALQRSFPHVKTPTASQEALLKALIPSDNVHAKSNKDPSLILRDLTGSGKSLALLLGLLSQRQHRRRKKIALPAIQQLLLVPHTELARQFEYWLELLNNGADNQSEDMNPVGSVEMELKKPRTPALPPAQAIYRGSGDLSVKDETSLLVATPNALLDVIDTLNLTGLQIIALDEADSMISPPGRFATRQEIRKWELHPPLILSLTERLLRPPIPPRKHAGEASPPEASMDRRIIATSATANSVLRDWLVRRSGWLGSEKGESARKQMDWYDFERDADIGEASQGTGIVESVYQVEGKKRMLQAEIQHYIVKVGQNASSPPGDLPSQTSALSNGLTEAQDALVETVATIFATEEVVSGVLIIGSGQSLTKTLEALRDLQVPATTISEGKDLPLDEPRLYVHSVDAVRGLDIPNLSHVFLLPGLAEDANSYLHVAGRVGRLTSGGKRRKGSIYCLVRSDNKHDEVRVNRCWELLGIEGQQYSIKAD